MPKLSLTALSGFLEEERVTQWMRLAVDWMEGMPLARNPRVDKN